MGPRTTVLTSLVLLAACGDTSTLDPSATAAAEVGGHAPAPHPGDLVLDETWTPRSGDVIDCHGGSILPRTRAADNGGLSVPQTLIFLGPGVHGVHIRKCTLDATFPILAMGGGFHDISKNVIRSTSKGVTFLGSDQNLVHDNIMISSGRSVQLLDDSDGNVVWRNKLSFSTDTPTVDGLPGFAWAIDREWVGIGNFGYPGVENFVVNGILRQDVNSLDTHADGNLILENTINSAGRQGIGIIFATHASHGLAQDNTIDGVELALAVFGYDDPAWFFEAGTCSGDPSIYCSGYDDPVQACTFPGLGQLGSCEGSRGAPGGGRVIEPSFVGNTVTNSSIGVFSGSTDGMLVERNDLSDGEIGIYLVGYPLDESTIQGNVASGNEVGLVIEDDAFNGVVVPGLDVSYNDFGDNERPLDAHFVLFDENGEVVDFAPFEKATTLPDNWWGGEACGLPPSAEWPNTSDPSAAAAPIAKAWRKDRADKIARCPL